MRHRTCPGWTKKKYKKHSVCGLVVTLCALPALSAVSARTQVLATPQLSRTHLHTPTSHQHNLQDFRGLALSSITVHVVDPDQVGSASFCRIWIGIQGLLIWIRICILFNQMRKKTNSFSKTPIYSIVQTTGTENDGPHDHGKKVNITGTAVN